MKVITQYQDNRTAEVVCIALSERYPEYTFAVQPAGRGWDVMTNASSYTAEMASFADGYSQCLRAMQTA